MARTGSTGSDIRAIALGLPQTQEIETWGDATFRVRNKMFVVLGPDEQTASIKASLDEQRALIDENPQAFAVASYVGRFGWVTATLTRVEPDQLEELVSEAWVSTAPKRLVKEWMAGRSSG